MNCRLTVVFAALALGGMSSPALAQARISTRVHAPATTAGPPRPAPPPRGQPGGLPVAPFRSGLVFLPKRGPHAAFPVRLPWFGLVYLDPYWWAADAVSPEALPPPDGPAPDRPTGGMQLDVEPRRAMVYVDGFYVGLVDQFSGYFHHLDLPAGPHFFEFVAPDYEPLLVDLVVAPGKTTTYRSGLNRLR